MVVRVPAELAEQLAVAVAGHDNRPLRAEDLVAADAQRLRWSEDRLWQVRAAKLEHQLSSTPGAQLHFPEARLFLVHLAVVALKYSLPRPVDPVVSRSSTSLLALTDDIEIRTGRPRTLL